MPEADRIKSDLKNLIKQREELRNEWRTSRELRLKYKRVLKESQDNTTNAEKQAYFILRKKQKTLSKKIRHVERKISRRMNGENKI